MSKKRIALTIVGTFLVLLFTMASDYDSVQEMRWARSAHADETAEAFVHWDEDDPAVVPASCARCHSNNGFLDFVGADGSTPWVVDGAADPGIFHCEVCHQSSGAPRDLGMVTFPSGETIEGLGAEAICMQCHQGRASTSSVDNSIANAAVGDDTVSGDLSFINIHYYSAAASQYGTLAKGGYQYAGKAYDGRFQHLTGYNACYVCHEPHSLEIDPDRCSTCHSMVTEDGHFHDIRYIGSLTDYDGDGNFSEGIYYEIQTLEELLYQVIRAYANSVVGVSIAYDTHVYPYFFKDVNDNGEVDESEANYGNRYSSWTPRLLRAAYNYQVVQKDHGGFAHGGKYLIQLLFDSIMDTNSAVPNPVAVGPLTRNDEGHFNGSAEAFRHWDEDDPQVVSGSCAKCHSATGLPEFLETGENTDAPIANGFLCTTCHTSPPFLVPTGPVTFPSGAILSMGDSSNICLNCHQGRASKKTVDQAIASGPGPYGFINIHYYPTAAVIFGTLAKGGYEYPGKIYAGQRNFPNHMGKFDTCVECHMGTNGAQSMVGHNVKKPNPVDCVNCHGQDISQPFRGADPAKFRFDFIRPYSTPDYDADGNMRESVREELDGLEAALYAQMQAYGFAIGNPIIYDSHAYPYFFSDTNGNGLVDPGEANYGNRYQFNAQMLKAAYNYQVSQKEPNNYIHNSKYIAQLLVDSIGSLGGNAAKYWWR